MTAPTDLSLMDFLFEREDPILNLSDKEFNLKMEPKNNDIMSLDSWPSNTDDFLDSLLKYDHPFEILGDAELSTEPVTLHATDEFILGGNCSVTDEVVIDGNCSVTDEFILDGNCLVKDELVLDSNYSDSGVSSDQQLSPMLLEADDEDPGYLMSSLSSGSESSPIASSRFGSDHESLMQEEVELDSSVFNVLDTSSFGEVKLENNKAVISMNILSTPQRKEKLILSNLQKRRTLKPTRQVIRVAPVTGNPRSILLPISLKDVKDFKTIKIINAASSGLHQKLQATIAGFRAGTSATVSSLRTKAGLVKSDRVQDDLMSDNSSKEHLSSGETSDESSSSRYPRLQLSLEEKRLLQKEGVRLPSHYPLTKLEERELKRIRRKIRNKISAQDSRKRKKEYIDGLEDRVKQCTNENMHLVKRIKALENQNQTLSSQLKKLQVALSRGTAKSAQPATCLMVLMLSMALVMVPNLRPNQTVAQTELNSEQDLTVPESKLPPLAGRSRSLLYSPSLAPEDSFLMDEDSMDEDKSRQLMSGIEDLLQFNSPLLDHDYEPPPTKRTRTKDPIKLFPPKGYMIPPVDDLWPPPTPSDIIAHKVETMTSQLKVNVSEPGGHRTVVLQVPKEQ